MKRIAILLCALVLSGCASMQAQVGAAPASIFADQAFAPPTEPIGVQQAFTLSPAMRDYLQQTVRTAPGSNPQRRLFNALYAKGQLLVEYDASKTRLPAETFEQKAGNCLSLVLLTAAFAKELGLDITYQNVLVDETFSRSGNLVFASHHVNITLGKLRPYGGTVITARDDEASLYTASAITIDFLPPPDARALRSLAIDENTVLAMYMNNRAAESLAAGDLNNAYAWAAAGVRQYPGFVNTYNTLGVIYSRRGLLDQAETTLRYALLVDPDNRLILSNLVPVLAKQGKDGEAGQLRERVARLDPHPPFEFFDKGMEAARRGAWAEARDYFRREVRRAPYYHEFHFWLAMASYKLGELDTAREEMDLAVQTSTTRRDSALYEGKLAALRQMRLR
ncbi:tetratricopeptide repeat protein [Massilia sp. TS11]|uniref:tetratricopeptide repeat protein n=1 Tax=Massilia sp. TS11 TaxID=2908003 RepID=UPI001EDB682D|nr:tetratricopeptide repeat protein [Massilia sp. TS11]MCG2586269.1 hypothetical protein [Massilia sp. TS11]